MPFGVYFGLAAYTVWACSDALIKSLGSGLSPFLIAFWAALFSSLPPIFMRPPSERLVDTFKSTMRWRLILRGVLGFLAALCVVYSFTHIPLAETYALVFLTPVFSTILSVIILKESMTPGRWVGLLLGFTGVMLVVRPGFRELQLGHLTAIMAPVFASIVSIVLRQVSQVEKRITIIGYAIGFSLLANGTILIGFGLPILPSPPQLLTLAIVGTLGGFGNILIINAAKHAPMAWVAPTQYIQIVWAVIFGALFFAEIPGPFTQAGLLVMAVAGYLCFPTKGNRGPVGGFAFLFSARRPRRKGGRPVDRIDHID